VVAGRDAELCVAVDDARVRARERDVGEEADDEAGADGGPVIAETIGVGQSSML
jgi:hypothetical protein